MLFMLAFYTAYFAKLIHPKRQGTQAMILGEGDKPLEQINHEKIMKVASHAMPQILNEEKFLERAFGEDYTKYKSKIRRYI